MRRAPEISKVDALVFKAIPFLRQKHPAVTARISFQISYMNLKNLLVLSKVNHALTRTLAELWARR